MDRRHLKRVKLVQELFALSFKEGQKKKNIAGDTTLKEIQNHKKEIDEAIGKFASRFPIEKIAKIDLAILRLAIFELLFEKKNPTKVIIDEAVLLAKEYGNERSYAFVNGVLGSLLKDKTF